MSQMPHFGYGFIRLFRLFTHISHTFRNIVNASRHTAKALIFGTSSGLYALLLVYEKPEFSPPTGVIFSARMEKGFGGV
jgi:hypothetical protein